MHPSVFYGAVAKWQIWRFLQKIILIFQRLFVRRITKKGYFATAPKGLFCNSAFLIIDRKGFICYIQSAEFTIRWWIMHNEYNNICVERI